MAVPSLLAAPLFAANLIALDGGSRFVLPPGWTADKAKTHVRITAPEKDASVSFLELPYDGRFRETAAEAWKRVDSGFALKPYQESSPPPADGWEHIHQIVYDAPAKEARAVVALIRVLRGRAYVSLIDASTAGLSRRGAQLGSAIESWKPEGLKEPDLSGRKPKAWGKAEERDFEEFVRGAMKDLQVPGAAVAIVRDGRLTYSRGFGVKKLDGAEPVAPDTPFMIGSMTKPLTTLLIARLIEGRKLSWSTPVGDVLKGFQLGDPSTARRLEMRHTACACTGMPRRDFDFIFEYEGVSPEQRLALMKDMKPTTDFGETFQYSNLLVAAGGYAAARAFNPEDALGPAYERAMRTLVFEPVGMRRSVLRAEEALPLGAAFPHGVGLDGRVCELPLKVEGMVSSVAPAGAVWSTVLDISNYILLELRRGKLPDGAALLSENLLLERRKPGIKIGEKSSYGLGLALDEDQGLRFVGHGGNTLGFSSDMFFIPDANAGMVVLANAAGANRFLGAAKQKYLELSFGAAPRAAKLVEHAAAKEKESMEKLRGRISPAPAKTRWIESLVGSYASPHLGAAALRKAGERFIMDAGEWQSELGVATDAGGERLLALTSPPFTGLEFRVSKDGRTLTLDGGQMKYVFDRK